MCFTETWLHQDRPNDHVSISGLQTVGADQDAPRTVSGKEGDLLFSSTTVGVILITLTAKNGSVGRTLNCWLLESGHIIYQGVLTRSYCSCLRDFNHISASPFVFSLLFLFYSNCDCDSDADAQDRNQVKFDVDIPLT